MEERMCQQRKSSSKHTQTNYLYQQSAVASHQCKMCSSFSTSSSSSSSTTSSFSSLSSSSTKDSPSRRESFDKKNNNGCFIQQHLQSMFILLRMEETLKMAVRLESAHPSRTRYLVVVSRLGRSQTEECCLLGIDCNERTTVGLVLRVLADTTIRLDGDGGFSVSVCGRQHIFKPVSVQAMWSALQTLYKASMKARECNYFENGNTHDWVHYYEQSIESDRSCLNEWHAMNDIESRRPPSPDSLRSKPRERLETERIIRSTLKEIMMSVDLDEVTSKYIRSRLEEQLDMDLREFKSFIDQEMLVILGQMDAATEIFPHVYLGSEWNASNLEELNKNGICHILNVTREIDNFFPGTFDYLNVRVYDDDNTDLLKHWDNTYKYINRVKKENSKVLVHCKMGISRSASVVIAYAMKACNWDFKKAFEFVQKKRSCIKPNQNFINQLETYQGMLDAMKNKEKLQRSKSETNLKTTAATAHYTRTFNNKKLEENTHADTQSKIDEKACKLENDYSLLRVDSGVELAQLSLRPKSWSPDNLVASEIFSNPGTMSQSLEQLNIGKLSNDSHSSSASSLSTSPPRIPPAPPLPPLDSRYNLNVRMPCDNGLTYSVSQNKIVQLYSQNQAKNVTVDGSGDDDEARQSESPSNGEHAKVNHRRSETAAYGLQIPSQFQGKFCTFKQQQKTTNLVITDGARGGTDDHTRKQSLQQQPKSRSSSSSSSSTTVHFVQLLKEDECGGGSLRVGKRVADTECSESSRTTMTTSTTTTLVCYQRPQNEAAGSRPQDEIKSVRVPFDAVAEQYSASSTTKKYATENGPPPECAPSPYNAFDNNELSSGSRTTYSTTTCVSNVDYAAAATAGGGCSSTVTNAVQLLERLKQRPRSNRGGAEHADESRGTGVGGLVRNLKKNFEAPCGGPQHRERQRKRCSFPEDTNSNAGAADAEARSLPPSPVGEKSPSGEDLSVRKLVGAFEKTKCGRERCQRKQQPPIPPRKSSLDLGLAAPPAAKGAKASGRRGVAPIVKSWLNKPSEIRSSVTKAANMLQQGKQYPLAKLRFCQPRSGASSVYNTV